MTLLRRSLLATALLAAGVASASDASGPIPAGQLPRTVVPSLVQLELKLDPKQERFSGTHPHPGRRRQSHRCDLDARPRPEGQQAPRHVLGRWQAHRDLTVSAGACLRRAQADGAADRSAAGKAMIEMAYEAPFGQLDGAYRVKPDGNDYVRHADGSARRAQHVPGLRRTQLQATVGHHPDRARRPTSPSPTPARPRPRSSAMAGRRSATRAPKRCRAT